MSFINDAAQRNSPGLLIDIPHPGSVDSRCRFLSVVVCGLGVIFLGQSSSAHGFADGDTVWLRVTVDVDNGSGGKTFTFYKSTQPPNTAPGSVTWTQISTHTTSGTTNLRATTSHLSLGARDSGTTGFWPGRIFWAEIRNGIGGTVVASPDFRTTTQLTTTAPNYSGWTDPQGNLFTAQPAGNGTIYTPQTGGVGNLPPHAVASVTPSAGSAPLNVNLSATASTDPETGTLTYAWDLDGDGQWDDSTSPTPTHSFPTTGEKTVSVRVTDPGGLTDTDEIIVTVTSGGTSATTRYGHIGTGDGAALVQSTTGAVLGRLLVLPGGMLLAKNVGGDRWSAPNVHGDVMAVTNATGIKQGATHTYDPYGQPLAGIPNNTEGTMEYGWVGQHLRPTETNTTLGYLEMGVRVYVPYLGRFLQQDPIEGGSANDYEYVSGDPINRWGVTGEVEWSDLTKAVGDAVGSAWRWVGRAVHQWQPITLRHGGQPYTGETTHIESNGIPRIAGITTIQPVSICQPVSG